MNKVLKKEFLKLLKIELSVPSNWTNRYRGHYDHNKLNLKIYKAPSFLLLRELEVGGMSLPLTWWEKFVLARKCIKMMRQERRVHTQLREKNIEEEMYKILDFPKAAGELVDSYKTGGWME